MLNKMSNLLAGVLVLLASINTAFSEPGKQSDADNRPNIILIMVDDLGYEAISANGGQSYQTPNLDRLAKQGMRFTNAFAQPLCTPSRVKLMTGKYNIRNYTKFGRLDRGEKTFANLLQKDGYKTAIAGKWQLGTEVDAPQHFGFEQALLWQHTTENRKSTNPKFPKLDSRYPNPEVQLNGEMKRYHNGEYGPDVMANYLVDFIRANKDGPFLAYYPMLLTHCPFDTTPDSKGWDPESYGSLAYKGDGDIRDQQRNFADMVEYMDKLVGRIADTLDQLGIKENTLLIITGDNGTDKPIKSQWQGMEVAGAKGTMTDAGTRVPLIVSWPGKIKPGSVSDQLIEFSDFLPTMLQTTGTPLPADYSNDGISFLPTLFGQTDRVKDNIHVWYKNRGVFVRNEEYSLFKKNDKVEFFDVRKPFQKINLDLKNLSKSQQAVYNQLDIRMMHITEDAEKQ